VFCVLLGIGGVFAWNVRGEIHNDYVAIGVGGLGFIAMLWTVCWFCALIGSG